METNVARAINLSRRISPEKFSEANDHFCVLAKFAENVQECAVQHANKKLCILESLEVVSISEV